MGCTEFASDCELDKTLIFVGILVRIKLHQRTVHRSVGDRRFNLQAAC